MSEPGAQIETIMAAAHEAERAHELQVQVRANMRKAQQLHRRAQRKPLGSNGREKDEQRARYLIEAVVYAAEVHGVQPDNVESWIEAMCAG